MFAVWLKELYSLLDIGVLQAIVAVVTLLLAPIRNYPSLAACLGIILIVLSVLTSRRSSRKSNLSQVCLILGISVVGAIGSNLLTKSAEGANQPTGPSAAAAPPGSYLTGEDLDNAIERSDLIGIERACAAGNKVDPFYALVPSSFSKMSQDRVFAHLNNLKCFDAADFCQSRISGIVAAMNDRDASVSELPWLQGYKGNAEQLFRSANPDRVKALCGASVAGVYRDAKAIVAQNPTIYLSRRK